MFNVKVIRKYKKDYPKLFDKITNMYLHEAGRIVEGAAKDYVPVDSGRLKNSITSKIMQEKAFIGTNVEYAPHVEYGTRFMRAQPYLRPAIDKNKRALLDLYRDKMRRAFG